MADGALPEASHLTRTHLLANDGQQSHRDRPVDGSIRMRVHEVDPMGLGVGTFKKGKQIDGAYVGFLAKI